MSDDESDAGVTEVSIETPALSVTIKAPGVDLAEARAHAVAIYREIYEPGMRASALAAGSSMGFVGAAPDGGSDNESERGGR